MTADTHASSSFGLLAYHQTGNLGDEIQSLASAQFLPRIDHYVPREELSSFHTPSKPPTRLILNGWFCHKPLNWPPSPDLLPLILSFHISPGWPRQILLSEPVLSYLRAAAPIGARDPSTLAALEKAGIPAYFSGCMTLTLQRPDIPRDNNMVVANELQPDILEAVQKRTKKKIVQTYHVPAEDDSTETKFKKARALLDTYARASCVITHRLHCALPCLAMGTPVLLIDTAPDQLRFDGLNNFVRHCTTDYFLANPGSFDIDNPTPNAELHIPYRQALIERVTKFINAPLEEIARPYPLNWEQRYRLLERQVNNQRQKELKSA